MPYVRNRSVSPSRCCTSQTYRRTDSPVGRGYVEHCSVWCTWDRGLRSGRNSLLTLAVLDRRMDFLPRRSWTQSQSRGIRDSSGSLGTVHSGYSAFSTSRAVRQASTLAASWESYCREASMVWPYIVSLTPHLAYLLGTSLNWILGRRITWVASTPK